MVLRSNPSLDLADGERPKIDHALPQPIGSPEKLPSEIEAPRSRQYFVLRITT